MKKTAMMLLAIATMAQADFSRSTAGVVTDNKTKLEWQDDYSDNLDADGNATITLASWSNALTYCHDLELDGGGWRLPNINELKSIIVDKAKPTIDGKFENTSSYYYWSSTSYASGTSYAWSVYFSNGSTYYGSTYYGSKYDSEYVRCVRAGQ